MSLKIEREPLPLAMDQDGVVRITGTRVTLDTVVGAFKDGGTAEEIAQQYPSVNLADIYAVIGYYLHRRDEVEAYLKEREETAQQVRQENEKRFDPLGVRERLLNRQARKKA